MITAPARPAPTRTRPLGSLRHSLVLAGRSLAKTTRNPGPAVNGIITPALFMVVFLYLFGGSVAGSTDEYLQYLLPGVLVMGAGLAGLVSTGTNITLDLQNGVQDRFRSLPISRVAPLLGSVLADVVRYAVAVAVLFLIGAALGFRVLADPAAALAAAGLAILFGFALSWVTVLIGARVRDTNAVLAFGFIAFLPLQLGTSLAAPTTTCPGGCAPGPRSTRSPRRWTPAAPCSTAPHPGPRSPRRCCGRPRSSSSSPRSRYGPTAARNDPEQRPAASTLRDLDPRHLDRPGAHHQRAGDARSRPPGATRR
jgi:oleandomycin transport system permease protein